MKRFVLFFLSFFLLLSLACGSALADETSAEPTATEEVTETEVVTPTASEVVSDSDVTTTSETDLLQQQLVALGSIQAYMLFFVVVILCFFAYKFFRMFF